MAKGDEILEVGDTTRCITCLEPVRVEGLLLYGVLSPGITQRTFLLSCGHVLRVVYNQLNEEAGREAACAP